MAKKEPKFRVEVSKLADGTEISAIIMEGEKPSKKVSNNPNE